MDASAGRARGRSRGRGRGEETDTTRRPDVAQHHGTAPYPAHPQHVRNFNVFLELV